MITTEVKEKLQSIIEGEVLFDELLANHSTVKVGGKVDVFITPKDRDELTGLVKFAKENRIDIFVLGAGSNVLFRDNGLDGIVISTAGLTKYNIVGRNEEGLDLVADAGVSINDLVAVSLNESVSGFEYLAGIPGTVGGALSMNAGTHDGSISDSLIEVESIDKSGRMYKWPKDKIEFSYRKARFPKSCVILSALFSLKKESHEKIEKRVNELRERRRDRHPLSWPSMGSVFKNPVKGPGAGQLIEEAGLKGVRVGGARISNEHGNWIINENNATSKDIEVLIHLAKEKVKETAEITLETEVVVAGKK